MVRLSSNSRRTVKGKGGGGNRPFLPPQLYEVLKVFHFAKRLARKKVDFYPIEKSLCDHITDLAAILNFRNLGRRLSSFSSEHIKTIKENNVLDAFCQNVSKLRNIRQSENRSCDITRDITNC